MGNISDSSAYDTGQSTVRHRRILRLVHAAKQASMCRRSGAAALALIVVLEHDVCAWRCSSVHHQRRLPRTHILGEELDLRHQEFALTPVHHTLPLPCHRMCLSSQVDRVPASLQLCRKRQY